MISFLSPLFFIGAAAAAVPILLHLLKRHPDARVKFPTVQLLRSAPVEHTSRRRLRELLLLALRVAALLFLALAFARPFMTAGSATGTEGVTIVALDTSLSMSAPRQFDRAKQLAEAAINQAPSHDAVGLVTFDDVARVAVQPTADRAIAVSAVHASMPAFGSTRYRAGINAAADALRGRPGRIVVVTDLLENGWDAGDRASVPEGAVVEVVDVGPPPANLAVATARVAGDRILASIRNAGPQPRDVNVRLMVNAEAEDARLAGETTTRVAANGSAEVSFAAPRGRWASVLVEDRNGIEADNTRFVVLENAGRPKLLVVTSTGELAREAFYLQQALLAAGADGGYDVLGAAAPELVSWNQERMDGHAAVVLTSTKALDRHGRELIAQFLRTGGGVLLTAGAEVDGAIVAETLAGARVSIVTPSAAQRDMQVRSLAPADVRHPIFRMFGAGSSSLALVQFHRIATIRAEECQTLARFTTGEPALVDCAPGDGRALVLASDLDNRWNDFPLHSSFVPFVHEAVRYLAEVRTRSSDYLVDAVPAGLAPVPGVFATDTSGGQSRLVAVNVDPSESIPARLTSEEFQTAVTRLKAVATTEQRAEAREQEERQHIWQYVLILVMAVLVIESVVGMRTA
jgi:Aerotolerance regulator N-terminal/von Willebrand factor type A domain